MEKKYHIGYIAGVFDLFHIGHLNLIKNAKSFCDILIVGVLKDNLVTHFKKSPPFIPDYERLEIVSALKYVDKAVLVDEENIDKIKAWNLYHFDCMFSGDDWKNNKSWASDKEKLNSLGSEIMFFKYTSCTSSSKIKKMIGNVEGKKEKIIIFGAGTFGQRAHEYFGEEVLCFIDNDPEKQNTIINNVPCLSPNKVINQLDSSFTIIIAMKNEKEKIQEMLKSSTNAMIKYFV